MFRRRHSTLTEPTEAMEIISPVTLQREERLPFFREANLRIAEFVMREDFNITAPGQEYQLARLNEQADSIIAGKMDAILGITTPDA